ncbi:hypothetical protein FKM82_013796 [Ascaphus truei]
MPQEATPLLPLRVLQHCPVPLPVLGSATFTKACYRSPPRRNLTPLSHLRTTSRPSSLDPQLTAEHTSQQPLQTTRRSSLSSHP